MAGTTGGGLGAGIGAGVGWAAGASDSLPDISQTASAATSDTIPTANITRDVMGTRDAGRT